jgi:lysophospholipase L1-like esterase
VDLFVLGDSICQGAGASERERGFVTIVARELKASVTALVRGGATSATGAEWVDYVSRAPAPDLALVCYGMNDQTGVGLRRRERVPVEQYETNLAAVIRRLRERIPAIVLIAPFPHRDGSRTETYLHALRRLTDPDVRVADPNPWQPAWYATSNHPNDDGHARIAKVVLGVIDHER